MLLIAMVRSNPVCKVCHCLPVLQLIDCNDLGLTEMPDFSDIGNLYKSADMRGNPGICGNTYPDALIRIWQECTSGRHLNIFLG